MARVNSYFAVAGALALAGCVVPPPTGPSVMALPPQGKNFTQFQQEDASCRQDAGGQIGYANPAAAANQTAVGSAAVGTVVGAAAGAAIGAAAGNPGLGAAVGAGSGLALGAGAGAANAAAVGGDLQQHYDIAYTQCMYAHGNQVSSPPPGQLAYAGYPYGYPYGYYGGYYPGAVIGLGFGGWGWRGGWGGGWGRGDWGRGGEWGRGGGWGGRR